ncbi:L-seryl-tRNA(Sec) selenium transferase [Janibacter alkaliphilus]|uniref:L-seryl-tRNA(Sec) selenium transferase n=1 Tax=Janibacter alkaliphilus TaxID=1069963 RepID=A0A852WZT2_9MICO|nr:L-seryl-tRNA(Sec) selenium transferase [Janibacter alkaliphilus]NYG36366.1 L-seryl-tRNA(Ser) seleniumtransferase [Janibacter alkaliphilus]
MSDDPRRRVPRTDAVLADPQVADALARHDRATVKATVTAAQQQAREGTISPDEVVAATLAALPTRASSLTPVLNATGVVVHTNLGRAPLSPNAIQAVTDAAGYVDVEMDLTSGVRSRRGAATLDALRAAVPEAGDALVVNNGAAALVLATTALAAGREVIVSRGEMVEIGDGFRLPDLIASTGARLREVGTTNRTHLRDYAEAVTDETGCILKVHPSNFWLGGFTSDVSLTQLRKAGLRVPVVMDLGSGLLAADRALPDEPDAASALRDGADLVTASGDKLLGGPQAGIVLGDADLIHRLRRHPLARAVRVDKLTLAALEATLAGPGTPVTDALHARADDLLPRTRRLAETLGREVVAVDGRVGGGGGPGVPLPGWAVEIPVATVPRLRRPEGEGVAVVARVDDGRGLVDLRCVPPASDDDLARALRAALAAPTAADTKPDA